MGEGRLWERLRIYSGKLFIIIIIIIIIFIANKTVAGKAIQYNTTLQNIYT